MAITPQDRDQERGAIAHNVQNVLNSFRNVVVSFKQGDETSERQFESDSLDELLPNFENEIIRFKMWAGNLAAHQSGPVSLDHRLREAPHLQEQVVYLLQDISQSLADAVPLTLPEGPPTNTQDQPGFAHEGSGSDPDSDDDFTNSDLDDDEDISPAARLSTLRTDVAEAIDCLLRLSVAIANPAPHERFRKLGGGPDEDVSFYEEHDVRYVQDKFPNIDQELPDVLGKFITRRRQFFKYREAHHAKLAAGLDQESQKDTSRTEVVPKTVASSLPERFKGTGVIDEDNRSDMAMSETSYATSAGFLMQEDGQMKPAPPLKVPPPPPEAEKGAFECPFCYRMISASTRGAWKRHVFGDLRPYTCLFSRCAQSNTDFDRRHRWQLHVSQYHWRTWCCPFECGGIFPSAIELKHHIRHQHLPNASDEHLSTVVARGEVSASDEVTNECPLCSRAISGLKSYIKHVGRHLEQLALFALPNIQDEEADDDVESDEQNDQASELEAASAADDSSEASSKPDEPLQTSETEDHAESGASGEISMQQEPASPRDASEKPREGSPSPSHDDGDLSKTSSDPPAIGSSHNTSADDQTQGVNQGKPQEPRSRSKLTTLDMAEPGRSIEEEPVFTGAGDEAEPPARPVYTRFAKKRLSIETLRTFGVEFDFDTDPEYLLVKRWVPEWEQDRMWMHTRRIREERASDPMAKTAGPVSVEAPAIPEDSGRPPQPTYTRFARRHLSIETLRAFGIDFDLDVDPDYVLAKRWVPEGEQDQLWRHTQQIREKRAQNTTADTAEPEFEWIRNPKKKGRRRTKPPSLLMYLAGTKPAGDGSEEQSSSTSHLEADPAEPVSPESSSGPPSTRPQLSENPRDDLEDSNDDPEGPPAIHVSEADSGEDESRALREESSGSADGRTTSTAIQDEDAPKQHHDSQGADTRQTTKLSGFFMCECCPEKPKRFEKLDDLVAHEAEKPFECSFCGNRFKTKNEADRHRVTHVIPPPPLHESERTRVAEGERAPSPSVSPPPPSPPPPVIRGPTIEREVITHYRDIDHGRQSEEQEQAHKALREQEYQKQLEDDLRKSGLDDAAINAILRREKIKNSNNPEIEARDPSGASRLPCSSPGDPSHTQEEREALEAEKQQIMAELKQSRAGDAIKEERDRREKEAEAAVEAYKKKELERIANEKKLREEREKEAAEAVERYKQQERARIAKEKADMEAKEKPLHDNLVKRELDDEATDAKKADIDVAPENTPTGPQLVRSRYGLTYSLKLTTDDEGDAEEGAALSHQTNVEAKAEIPKEATPATTGARCPTCAHIGKEVWVIPGRTCGYCGTPYQA